jgi:hypothetical protein
MELEGGEILFISRPLCLVETPLDAVQAFAESPVPVLCIDALYVEKQGHWSANIRRDDV